MKRVFASIMLGGLLMLPSLAGGIQKVGDAELEAISAQGFTMNFQTLDGAINSSLTNMAHVNIGQLNMVDSMFISGNAQQNAFVPINAVNSAVNVPINIVFVMNSNVQGGININNALNAALHP